MLLLCVVVSFAEDRFFEGYYVGNNSATHFKNYYDGTVTDDGKLKDKMDSDVTAPGIFDGSNYESDITGIHLNQDSKNSSHSQVSIDVAKNTLYNTLWTVELYVQDFQPGPGFNGIDGSYLFSAGTNANGAKFGIFYNNKTNEIQIRYNDCYFEIDFGNALANLQDALITVTVNTTDHWFAVYLNGTFLCKMTDSTNIRTFSSLDYVRIGDAGGCWCSGNFRCVRLYGNKLTPTQIKSNYVVDRAKYNKDVNSTGATEVPTWEDYDTANKNLKGYFAGQDPLITNYKQLVPNESDFSNLENISGIDKTGALDWLNTTKKFNHYWQNLANNEFGTAIWNNLNVTLNQNKVVENYKTTYLDRDGYHLGEGWETTLFNKTDNPTDDNYGFVDYNGSTSGAANDKNKAYNYSKDCLTQSSGFTIEVFLGEFITGFAGDDSVVFKMRYSSNNDKDEGGNDEFLFCYRNNTGNLGTGLLIACQEILGGNGVFVDQSITDISDKLLSVVFDKVHNKIIVYVDGVAKLTKSFTTLNSLDWTKIQLGSDHDGRQSSCTYRCIRVYDTALTADQIVEHFSLDKKLYKKTTTSSPTTPEKQETSYGLCGFDKILEKIMVDKSNYYNLGVTRELKLFGSNVTNGIGEGGYVNELLNDWEPATGLYITRSERFKYFVASMNTNTFARTPNNIDARATFYDMADGNGTGNFRGRSENKDNLINKSSGLEDSISDKNNGALCIQNSFFMRSKYKCGDGSVTVENGKITDSTKLMVTADIDPVSLKDTDFCGMVIDFSDEVWNRYDPTVDYSGYAWDGHERNDSMNTKFDGSGASLFETGVGFNLVKGTDNNVLMRVFVGGDGSNKSTKYNDVNLGEIGLTNFTIYREYTNWPYEKFDNDSVTIAKDQAVYLVKFYVNKKLRAIVVMGTNGTFNDGENTYLVSGDSGFIVKVNDDGSLDTVNAVKTCSFKAWNTSCGYGVNGKSNVGANVSASGNIIFAAHRKNDVFQNSNNNGFRMIDNDENYCRIVVDNIGYMDYHAEKKPYEQSYAVNQDMMLTLKSSLVSAREVFEPSIYFNRLGYDSSSIKFSDIDEAEYNRRLQEDSDFKASHGQAVRSEGINAQNSEITFYTYSVDGVYFKNICDNVTYDVIDFNGVPMFTMKLSAIDYFKSLYNLYINSDSTMSKNQINLMLDLIQLGKAISYYSGYYKAPDADTGRLEDFCIEGTEIDDDEFLKKVSVGDSKLKWSDKISGNNKENGAYYNSTALVLKNYISLLIQVNVPSTWVENIQEHFLVYEYSGDPDSKKGDARKLITDTDSLNMYQSLNRPSIESVVQNGDGNSLVTVEIKLALTDFSKQFYMELVDDNEVKSWYVYGLNNYCYSKWDNKDAKLSLLVRRLYHIGEVATYWDKSSDQEYQLWSKRQEVA